MRAYGRCAVAALLAVTAGAARGQTLFSDDFNSGAPSPLWGNERGAWEVADGGYRASQPGNFPPTYTSLPFTLGDLLLDVDVRGVSDGGIWLHSDEGAQNGVLLVTGGAGHSGRGFYWHIVEAGGYGPAVGFSEELFNQGDDIHVRVRVRRAEYSVYFNGSQTAASTLTTDLFPVGRVGLYDFTFTQLFDNVVLSRGCGADFNADGAVNLQDFLAFLAAYAAGDARADVDTDGRINIQDFLAYLAVFAAGC